MYESTRLDEKNLSKKPLPTTSPARDLNPEPPEFKEARISRGHGARFRIELKRLF
jgi:hypothetical protein